MTKQTSPPRTVEERLDGLEKLLHEVIEKLDRPKKLAYDVNEAAEALGISTRHVYELMNQNNFPVSLKLGSRRVISTELLEEWVIEQAGGHRLVANKPHSGQQRPRSKRIITLDLDGLIERYDRERVGI